MDEPIQVEEVSHAPGKREGGRSYQRDMRQSVKKKARYADAPHCNPKLSALSFQQTVRQWHGAVHMQPSAHIQRLPLSLSIAAHHTFKPMGKGISNSPKATPKTPP